MADRLRESGHDAGPATIGRTHARTPVLKLVQDHHVRIIDAATGELFRDIDPTRDYQPTGKDRHANQRRKPQQAEP